MKEQSNCCSHFELFWQSNLFIFKNNDNVMISFIKLFVCFSPKHFFAFQWNFKKKWKTLDSFIEIWFLIDRIEHLMILWNFCVTFITIENSILKKFSTDMLSDTQWIWWNDIESTWIFCRFNEYKQRYKRKTKFK